MNSPSMERSDILVMNRRWYCLAQLPPEKIEGSKFETIDKMEKRLFSPQEVCGKSNAFRDKITGIISDLDVLGYEFEEVRSHCMFEIDFNELRCFAEHNLEATRTENWKEWKGYGIDEDMHIEDDVIAAVKRYETYLRADKEPSKEFENIRDFSVEFRQWLHAEADFHVTLDDFYNEVIMDTGDMMNGDFSDIKQFLADNREFDDLKDEDGKLREDVSQSLEQFEQRLLELEKSYVEKTRTDMEREETDSVRAKKKVR